MAIKIMFLKIMFIRIMFIMFITFCYLLHDMPPTALKAKEKKHTSSKANSDGVCKKLPNGLERLAEGVDITKLDWQPLDLRKDDGFRWPIIDFTCKEGRKKTIEGKVCDIPDQIISISTLPSGFLGAAVSIYRSSEDIKKAFAANAEISDKFGLLSAGFSYKKLQKEIMNSSKYIEDVSAYVSAVKVNLLPYGNLKLSNIAKNDINEYLATALSESNIDAYNRIIEYYGTHHLESAKYGGLIRLLITTEQSYYQTKTLSDIQVQARSTFMNLISARGGGSAIHENVDDQFLSKSTTSIGYFGGDINLLSEDNGIPKWQPTVAANPWLFSGKLVPITELIEDRVIKKSLERAIEIYTDKAFLRELQRSIFSINTPRSLFQKIHEYNHQVTNLIKMPMPSHDDVVNLSNKFKSDFQPYSWFLNNFQLCFRWKPDADSRQCGGDLSQEKVCVVPNKMTPYYLDDTDVRMGGCNMSWGLNVDVVEMPTLFNQVKICFKWNATGDSDQCNFQESGEKCAGFGNFTEYYKDDTDKRDGGCKMQWKISVPENAPIWLKTTQLCFEWQAEDDIGQCGGGIKSNICAFANEYTEPYVDETDSRMGGCKMSWGVKVNRLE